ncbi:bolA-like protein 1 [Calypte anna]|uniref:bolA-like protein 1 n=1 Tax=Calypte anna TaxID=9244 RepID=UPI0011C3B3B7|nr:bolA-like protein 1 [Calypte anna]
MGTGGSGVQGDVPEVGDRAGLCPPPPPRCPQPRGQAGGDTTPPAQSTLGIVVLGGHVGGGRTPFPSILCAERTGRELRCPPSLGPAAGWPWQQQQQQQRGGGLGGGPLARSIRSKLLRAFRPTHLQVRDDSPRHGGPPGAETHFWVLVVSEGFQGVPLLQRHRMVQGVLGEELGGPLHSLSIVTKTPQQWEKDPRVQPPPPCLGGSKHEEKMKKKSPPPTPLCPPQP